MATKAKAQVKEEAPEKEAEGAPNSPLPLLDLNDAGVKKMIKAAKKRGFVTFDALNAVLPSESTSPEQIEDIMSMLSEMGINVVETEDAEGEEGETEKAADEHDDDEDDESGREVVEAKPKSLAVAEKKEPSERTDDPVRMYLREMGSVELLSREGEIAIAKRIEAGREAMIAGLCESPLTFQAVIIWRDELSDGKVFLRDIIDLEATYAGPDAKQMQVPVIIGPDGKPVPQAAAVPGATPVPGAPHLQVVQPVAPPAAPPAATPFKAPGEGAADGEEPKDPAEAAAEGDYDEDDMENSLSLAAIEAELKPKVVETFDNIADSFKRLRRLQEQDIEFRLKNTSLSPAQERKYKKLKEEIIAEVKSLRLNQARIDSLVEQLYDINKRLVSNEGRLMRLSESYGVSREDFLKHYMGNELDPRWLNRISKLAAKGWKNLVAKEKDRIKEIRGLVHELAGQTGVEIGEFRKIVHMVQKGEREARQAKKEMVEANLASRHLDRQEIHQPRPAIPRFDPGRQYRPDEGGRQIRIPPRLQVLDLRHLVDPPGDHAFDRRPGAHHPHSGAHDRDDQQDRAHLTADAQRDRPRADAGGARRKTGNAAGEGAQGPENRQGAALARDADRRRGRFAPRRFHRGQERHFADRRRDPVQFARDHNARARLRSPRARSACCACASASA